jgi:hypothetical protein
MKREERASQLWSLLVFAAKNRQILTYGLVAKLIGAPTAALGGWLEPIQSYCLINGLPALTVLVVSESTGEPGAGFIGSGNVPQDQQRVFAFDWIERDPPSPEVLRKAVEERPSNGVGGG